MSRNEKVANHIKELAASYLGREDNRTSLITVTGANCSPDMKKATIYITVLPTSMENAALGFAKRKRGDLREYLKNNLEVKTIPFIDFALDQGEKNRQRIDELLRGK